MMKKITYKQMRNVQNFNIASFDGVGRFEIPKIEAFNGEVDDVGSKV